MIKQFINHIAQWIGIKRRMFIDRKETTKKSVSISYAITVCNEAEPLKRLLDFLQPYLQEGDEIVVQADMKNVTQEVKEVVQTYTSVISRYVEHDLNFDFAQAKNHLNEQCQGEWIFQLDADECPQEWLMERLRAIITANEAVELYKIPRLNLFTTGDKIEEGHVAWPDYQGRLYRNIPERIHWQRPLHEKIRGHKAYLYLPKEERYAIRHLKVREQDNAKWQVWKEHYA